ncbi:unnamed protein product [Parascedosporium putredinis]|uniref:ATP-dependent DNA helicase CHL1 n=1 Tax=Parascedosporium putredinis TaxID=1442378 RepID=A0A9P1GVZ3_9PEZI|nr:unnamed protein product [Parascedosporium putredinis]CAI7988972.1 unnamed protein product [Parascedosporium putredinis]
MAQIPSNAPTSPQDNSVDFHHPYTPYDVQLQFMKAVYEVLQAGHGQIGILESPTGTGKSLSLICSSLTWLRSFKASSHEETLKKIGLEYADEPEWLVEQLLKRKSEELTRQWEEREERLEKIRQKEKAMEARRSAKRRRVEEETTASSASREPIDEDAEWLLDDWEGGATAGNDPLSGLSAQTRETLARMGLGGPRKADDSEDKLEDEVKLSQFISELRRPSFPSSYSKAPSSPGKSDSTQKEPVKLIPLASRQQLCINPSVSKLGSLSAINDRCAELQQSKSKEKRCTFMPKDETLSQTHQFRDTALATLPDIEDLYGLGKSLAAEQGIVDSNTLLRHKAIDQINMYKLVQYIQESKLAYKIESYVSHVEDEAQAEGSSKATGGRIFFQKTDSTPRDIQLSYLLLSPTHAFSSIATSARAVILAGGTMAPFDDYTTHLFPYLPAEKITTLSCGHVIPKENLSVWTLGRARAGDASSTFEFSFQRRGDKGMINDLGVAILNITFRESKGGSSDEILEAYSNAILSPSPNTKTKGALLLSVAKNASRAFYENSCMRAVNQSIGRAIRHPKCNGSFHGSRHIEGGT